MALLAKRVRGPQLHLFKKKYIKDLEFVKDEVRRIVAKQKPGSYYDLKPFKGKIEEMLDSISEFNPDWNRFPVVFRIASVAEKSTDDFDYTFRIDEKTGSGEEAYTYQENIVLPDTKHDFELVARMLNHMREQKKFKRVDVPLFIQPDELHVAFRDGRFKLSRGEIRAQMVIIFQRGSIMNIGFVFGRNYVILGT